MKLVLREPQEAALRAEMSEWDGYVSSALLAVEAIRACSRHKRGYAQDARERRAPWGGSRSARPAGDEPGLGRRLNAVPV